MALLSSTFSRLSLDCQVDQRMLPRKFRTFLRWMRGNGIEYTDGLAFELGGSRSVADVGVRAVFSMQANDLIATIPKQACLTVRTTAAAKLIEEEEIGGGLGLALALMYEMSLQERSRWYGYLQLLPREEKLPFLWSLAEIDFLLAGTELHQVIKEDKVLIEEDWKECIAPMTFLHASEFPAKWFTLDCYLAAKALVSSRAFEVDDYHGYGMVPLADLFNHKTADEDVHFTSINDSDLGSNASNSEDFSQDDKNDVKAMKRHKQFGYGRSQSNESGHIVVEGSSDVSPSGWEGNTELLEMILIKDVVEGSEIFNTYGTLSNAALLHRYGFTEPDNPFDIVNVDLALVSEVCLEVFSSRHIRRRSSQWRKVGCSSCVSQGCDYFEISASGEPQQDLLMLLFMMHLLDDVFDDFSSVNLFDQGIEDTARALGWEGPSLIQSKKRCRQSQQKGRVVKVKEKNIDLGSWLLTVPVCKSTLEILKVRDSLYPTSCLKDDVALLSTISCDEHPKEFYALILRIGEREILERCRVMVSKRLASLSKEQF